jgi:O-antigen ligase
MRQPNALPFPTSDGPALFTGILLALLTAAALATVGLWGALVVPGALAAFYLLTRPFAAWCVLVAMVAADSLVLIADNPVYALTGPKLIGFVLAGALALDFAGRRSVLQFDAQSLAILLFAGCAIASFAKAVNTEEYARDALTLFQLIILWIATRYLLTDLSRLRTFAIVAVTALSVGALVGLVGFVLQRGERAAGFSQNAAILASELLVALGFAWALFKESGQWRRAGLILLMVLLIGTMVASLSRAVWIAFPIAFVASTALVGRLRLAFLAGLALVIVSAVLAPLAASLRDSSDQVGSDRAHVLTLRSGIAMVEDNPLLGVGLGNYPEYYLGYSSDERGLAKSAHNTWLTVAAEMGLPALAVFALLHFVGLWNLWRVASIARRSERRDLLPWVGATIFALVALMVYGLMHSLFVSKLLWILLAISSLSPAMWLGSERREAA